MATRRKPAKATKPVKGARKRPETHGTHNPPETETSKRHLNGDALWQRRRRVYAAWCQGRSQLDVADAEGVHHSQVSRDLAAMFEDLGSALTPEDRRKALLEMLARIAYAEAELLAAWERSKKPRQRTKGKKVESDKKAGKDGKPGAAGPVRREAETVTEGRDGNPRFMEVLKSQWELKARLLNLVVTKVAHGGDPDAPPIPVKHEHDVVGELAGYAGAFRQFVESLASGEGGGEVLPDGAAQPVDPPPEPGAP